MESSARILVTGATGFVGRVLCTEALRRGMTVRAAVREGSVPGCECAPLPGLSAAADWTAALAEVSTVIHLAARVHVMQESAADPLAEFRKTNVEGTERLARQAARNGVKRLVFVSSIKVNGEATEGDARFAECSPASPRDAYGLSKWEAEQALWRVAADTGLEVVVVRPPLVYGPAVKGNFAAMLAVLRRRIPLPFASIRNARSLLYVGNLADALLLCATHPSAARNTYLVSDGEDISTPDLLRRLGQAMGKPARLLPCPVALLEAMGRLTGKTAQVERLIGSLRVDSGKIRREVGWSPPYSIAAGLQATVG